MNDRGVPGNGRERPGRRYPSDTDHYSARENSDDRRRPNPNPTDYEPSLWDRPQASRADDFLPPEHYEHGQDSFHTPRVRPENSPFQTPNPYEMPIDAAPDSGARRSSSQNPDYSGRGMDGLFRDEPISAHTRETGRNVVQLTAIMPAVEERGRGEHFDPYASKTNIWQDEAEDGLLDAEPAERFRSAAPPKKPRESDEGQPRRGIPMPRKRRFAKRHPVAFSFLMVFLIVGILGGLYVVKLAKTVDTAIDQIKHEDLMPSNAPAPLPVSDGMPMAIALFGTDFRPEEAGRDNAERSDTIMLAYLPADRKQVYLISLPRDYYVPIPIDPKLGICGAPCKSKINAAYAWGKTQLSVETIQELLGININHIGIINCGDFIKLSEVLGGIEVDNPVESFTAPYNAKGDQYHWPKGKITIKGEEALAFVRQRKGLGETDDNKDDPANYDPRNRDDFGRAKRQRLVLAGIAQKMLSAHVLTDPAKAEKVISETFQLITVDTGFTSEAIRNLILTMRITGSGDVKQLAAPVLRTGDEPGVGNVLYPDMEALEELSIALKTDKMQDYYEKHKDDPAIGRKN